MKNQYILILLLYIVLPIKVHSQDIPRIAPRDIFISYSELVGDLTEGQFLAGALLASGSDGQAGDVKNLELLIDRISNNVRTVEDSYEKGEAILQNLHELLFKSYQEDQTRVDVLLDTGRYNCVSSAVLYMAAGRASGLNVQAVRTPDHAFASVIIDDQIIDVETTNEWGYDPGRKKEFTDSFSGSTGYNYVPPGNYNLRSDISDKQMIGLILQNRIAELQRSGNHRSTIPLAVDRYALTRTEEAKKDMYDTFSNYSSQLNSSGNYESGILFLRGAVDLWGASQTVARAFEALVHNSLLSVIEKENSIDAENLLLEFSALGIMSSDAVKSNQQMIYDKKAVDMINSHRDFNDIRIFLDESLEEGYLTKNKWINYTLFIYIKNAEALASEKGWLNAYMFVLGAPSDIKNQRKYIQLLSSCKGNYVITIHNRFADLYNSGKHEEAEQLILQGLNVVPGNNTLKSDLQMIQRKDT